MPRDSAQRLKELQCTLRSIEIELYNLSALAVHLEAVGLSPAAQRIDTAIERANDGLATLREMSGEDVAASVRAANESPPHQIGTIVHRHVQSPTTADDFSFEVNNDY